MTVIPPVKLQKLKVDWGPTDNNCFYLTVFLYDTAMIMFA